MRKIRDLAQIKVRSTLYLRCKHRQPPRLHGRAVAAPEVAAPPLELARSDRGQVGSPLLRCVPACSSHLNHAFSRVEFLSARGALDPSTGPPDPGWPSARPPQTARARAPQARRPRLGGKGGGGCHVVCPQSPSAATAATQYDSVRNSMPAIAAASLSPYLTLAASDEPCQHGPSLAPQNQSRHCGVVARVRPAQ
jgi:hypothetical protein